MNPMISKFVDSKFMTEEQAQYVENAINNNESIVISGHRSTGSRPFMVTLMGVAKKEYTNVQVKGFEDLEADVQYLFIPALDGLDFEQLVGEAIGAKAPFITLKEPEHPVSLMKVMKEQFKKGKGINKKIHTIEARKVDGVPYVDKITEMHLDENGKVVKTDL